jgi:hypothetical protein
VVVALEEENMAKHHHARSYTVISIDIVNSSSGGSLRHTRLVEGLHEAVAATVSECPSADGWLLRRDGDSMTIAVPAEVGKGEVLSEFPHRIDRELRRFNSVRVPEGRLWIRAAVSHGDVVVADGELLGGDALVEAARIRDIEPLRRAMDAMPQAYVGLVLTDDVHRTVREGDPSLMPEAYRLVEASAKDYRGRAWIRLIGVEAPGGGGGGGPTGTREPRPPEPGPFPRGAPDPRPADAESFPGGRDSYITRVDVNHGSIRNGPGN